MMTILARAYRLQRLTTMACLVQLYIIDAFVSKPFTGNPAAVCLLDYELSVGSYSPVDVQYAPGGDTGVLVRLPDNISREEFESISPDLDGLMDVYNRRGAPGVILTVKGNSETGSVDEHGRHFDFLSRFFDPWNGVPEDPVTGAAHCVLAGYWSKVLGKNCMYARQCSRRGGNVEVEVLDGDRVELTGTALIMFEGKIHL